MINYKLSNLTASGGEDDNTLRKSDNSFKVKLIESEGISVNK